MLIYKTQACCLGNFQQAPAIYCQSDNGTAPAEDNLFGVYNRLRAAYASSSRVRWIRDQARGSLELPSDLGQVSVGGEQHRTRLYELSNLERVSMCAPDV